MIRIHRHQRLSFIAMFAMMLLSQVINAQQLPDKFQLIQRFVGPRTALVGMYSPGKLDAAKMQELQANGMNFGEPDDPLFSKSLSGLGVEQVFVVADFAQLFEGAFVIAIPTRNPEAVSEFMTNKFPPKLPHRKVDGFLLLSTKESTLDTAIQQNGKASNRLVSALTSVSGNNMVALALPEDNSAITIAIQAWKNLANDPESQTLVDRLKNVRFATASGDLPSPMSAQLTFTGSEDAKQWKEAVDRWIATKVKGKGKGNPPHFNVVGDAVRYEVATNKDLINQIESVSGNTARDSISMNNIKQIMLAMHMFHDVHQRFPPQALADSTGKKLLSWRVMILPYIEQNELYKQFHMDEPWDSEHNRTLIDKMPTIYKTPGLNKDNSKTRYVVPLTAKSIFGRPGAACRIFDITDGTSNTIAIVESMAERSVIWTKPDDFVVDAENPINGLAESDRESFIAGFADGSVRRLKTSAKKSTLLNLFDASDGQVIDSNDF